MVVWPICLYEWPSKVKGMDLYIIDQAILAHFVQMGDVGIRFGCPSGLTQSNPNKWENGGVVSRSFKTT